MDVNLGPEIRTDFRPQSTDVNDVPPLFAGAVGGREYVRSDPAKPLSTCDKMRTIVPEEGGKRTEGSPPQRRLARSSALRRAARGSTTRAKAGPKQGPKNGPDFGTAY